MLVKSWTENGKEMADVAPRKTVMILRSNGRKKPWRN